MSEPFYLAGNTVRLYGTFYHMENRDDVIQPELVNLIIYDYKWDQIESFVVGLDNYNESTGAYTFDYVFQDVGTFYYEWNGMVDGMPSIEREKVKIKQF